MLRRFVHVHATCYKVKQSTLDIAYDSRSTPKGRTNFYGSKKELHFLWETIDLLCHDKSHTVLFVIFFFHEYISRKSAMNMLEYVPIQRKKNNTVVFNINKYFNIFSFPS